MTGQEEMPERRELKHRLANYTPTEEERSVIKSAIFDVINLSTVGAGALGMSGHLWSRSRPKRTGIPTILGFFAGLTLGGMMGMEKGMRTLRNHLPPNSTLLDIIHSNDRLRMEQVFPDQPQTQPQSTQEDALLSDTQVEQTINHDEAPSSKLA
ncbi:hypothetical protein BCR43DRAFT_491387 [Syncephalastrum racemosum]|uniref:Uncharacterized protein n=1 Tax=Syncephalastrum racemosum TaxID=13706 RepID=A0A1X2HBV1_SYNRA|nr:hypothetical protein BCR43DRAFT_491387 [Syncephalastrum racemosum]